MQNNNYMKFWGVRGTFPITSQTHAQYGGNTSCVELCLGDHIVILDAGTGLRNLGCALLQENKTLNLDILVSHTHLDHILGIPFFKPFFDPSYHCRFWAGHLKPERILKDVLSNMMTEPFFPIPLDIFKADISYNDFLPGDVLDLGDKIKVQTIALNHPNNATGYRINYQRHSICYVTDTEHIEGQQNQAILDLIHDADYFIYDATYSDAEYHNHRKWGHSTWEEGFRLAQKANVKNYIIFHHDPDHDDLFMDKIVEQTQNLTPNTIVAYEGLKIGF